jgi:capsular polysaccharide biosynthesis protein
MDFIDLKILLKRKLGTLILMGVLGASLAFFLLMFTTPHYRITSEFLVVQTSGGNQDFYSQFKSSEYLSKVLAEAIQSESYINAVIETGKVSPAMLPVDKKDRLEEWAEMVTVKKNLELGVIEIQVSGDNQKDITAVMEGVTDVLVNKNVMFRGGAPESVQIKTLSGPILERVPGAGLMIKTILAGFLAGFFVTLLVVFLKARKKSVISNQLAI